MVASEYDFQTQRELVNSLTKDLKYAKEMLIEMAKGERLPTCPACGGKKMVWADGQKIGPHWAVPVGGTNKIKDCKSCDALGYIKESNNV